MGTMCVLSKTLFPTSKGCKSGHLVFHRDWSQECYHGNNIVGVILFLLWCTSPVPSLTNTAPTSLDIFLIQYFTVQVNLFVMSSLSSFARYKNLNVSLKWKKIFQKGKCRSSLLWKAFQISGNHFLLHRHLKINNN